MNSINIITPSLKNKHLSLQHYEFVINEIIKHEAKHHGKKRNTGKVSLIKFLASQVGASVSTIYEIMKDARIVTRDTYLKESNELSASAAFNIRTKQNKNSNISKLESAKPFLDLVISEVQSNCLSSIDETINYFKIHCPEKIKGMETVCTKTFYNYVHQGKVIIKPIDLPRMTRRKKTKNYKTYIPKRQKGTSITERPFEPNDRKEFGHWEGDLVVGPRDGQSGALLTLIERKTRFYYMIPITRKSSKLVYMKINKLHAYFGESFSEIFKSITFDNGNEFSRYKDIEVKPNTKVKRTLVFFGRPYRSCDRASNENCNGLVRYHIKKGTDINTIKKYVIKQINKDINNKKRKINGYLPSLKLFQNELNTIGFSSDHDVYEKIFS